ncbi:MAG: hypothetical protein IJV28_07245 [Paludibacteraceae bacterium]|nr:hypothetical protein [Paludibacteraceae bacterium]
MSEKKKRRKKTEEEQKEHKKPWQEVYATAGRSRSICGGRPMMLTTTRSEGVGWWWVEVVFQTSRAYCAHTRTHTHGTHEES